MNKPVTPGPDRDYIEAMVDCSLAAQVHCCKAGRIAFPLPCPWHGESDPTYAQTRERMPWHPIMGDVDYGGYPDAR